MFRFHGNAIGAAGKTSEPYDDVIPAQASAALPEIGGVARSRAGKFDYRGIFRFEEARVELVGRYDKDDDAHETLIMATVEGLNVLEMVTADRIVARLVSMHRRGESEPSITPIGSHFDNLRIAGYRVTPRLAIDTFHKFSTFSSLASAYRDDKEGCRGQMDQVGSPGKRHQASERAKEYIPAESLGDQLKTAADTPQQAKPTDHRPARAIYSTSLVRGIEDIPELAHSVCGHVIEIEGFGVIRLAEFHIARYWKRLNMLQINLGSPIRGEWLSASAEGNGSDW